MSGSGAGGGIGATLGTIAAAALAPETGGASLLADAGMDAGLASAVTGAALGTVGGGVGGALGAGVTGGNVGQSALMGGAGGLFGGALSGLLGGAGDAAAGGADAMPATDGTTATTAADSTAPTMANSAGTQTAADQYAANALYNPGTASPLNSISQDPFSASDAAASPTSTPLPTTSSPAVSGGATPSGVQLPGGGGPGAGGGGAGSGGFLNGLENNFNKNPLAYAGLGMGVLGALMPAQGNKINQQQLLANQQQINPGFYASLPQYNMTSQTNAPASQNWYTYGQRPQSPIYTSQITPAKHGGLMKSYAHGGVVQKFALGGMPVAPAVQPTQPMPIPQGTPQPGGVQQPMPSSPLDALAGPPKTPQQAAARTEIGNRIGKALRNHIVSQAMFQGAGKVNGAGDGQSDSVPAKLSDGEYVMPADTVSHLGNGSTAAGAKKLDGIVHNVRAHRVSHGSGFPPKAKSPLSYVKKGKP